MQNVREEKKQLRQRMLTRRRGLPASAVLAGSAQIAAHLRDWPIYRRAGTVMLYLAMADEPQTEAMIEDARTAGKTVCVPMLRAEYGMMDAARIDGPDDLITGKLGLRMPDPAKAQLVSPGAIDLVVVPGVAFDAAGRRLGMGAGYYDRFLPQAERACRLGLAWSFQVAGAVPQGLYDVTMHYLLTEDGIISCE
ncbi:MAG TPA: 5-formyltetrahydrofolate cyclo-ligase [Selenomonadales bacterium]|nr:5-formyltetrahydrofolate cyclo-ligase [Selenomonadales bacterium]